MNIKRLGLLAVSLLMTNLACIKQDKTVLVMSDISEVKITYADKSKGKGDLPLKTIISAGGINQLIAYANRHIFARPSLTSAWCRISKVQGKSTYVDVSFYRNTDFMWKFGIGRFGKDQFFLEYVSYNKVKNSCISAKEKDELLKLLDLNETEHQYILNYLK